LTFWDIPSVQKLQEPIRPDICSTLYRRSVGLQQRLSARRYEAGGAAKKRQVNRGSGSNVRAGNSWMDQLLLQVSSFSLSCLSRIILNGFLCDGQCGKFKRLRRHRRRAWQWLGQIAATSEASVSTLRNAGFTPPAGQWEPGELRGSRRVLRGPGVRVPRLLTQGFCLVGILHFGYIFMNIGNRQSQ